MANWKPQVTYMTNESLRAYRSFANVNSPYKRERFKTYAELKKALKNRILHEHILEEEEVSVVRSRRGEFGEWFEHWALVNGKPKIIKQGWN